MIKTDFTVNKMQEMNIRNIDFIGLTKNKVFLCSFVILSLMLLFVSLLNIIVMNGLNILVVGVLSYIITEIKIKDYKFEFFKEEDGGFEFFKVEDGNVLAKVTQNKSRFMLFHKPEPILFDFSCLEIILKKKKNHIHVLISDGNQEIKIATSDKDRLVVIRQNVSEIMNRFTHISSKL